MAGNLPIHIPYKLGQQPVLPQAGMPNMTLPPLKLPDIPPQQTSIFTSNPIIDVTKMPTDTQLSSIFGQTELPQAPTAITQKRVITDEELEKEKEEIRKMLQPCDCEDETENILDSITKDNLELAKIICKDKNFTIYYNIWRIPYILEATNADNLELAKIICKDKSFTNYHNIGEIKYILHKTNADNIELAKIICQNERFTNDNNIGGIDNILSATNGNNTELANFLCNDEKFTNDDNIGKIKYILLKTNANNIELANFLCHNEKFTNEDNIEKITAILRATNNDNIKLANFLCKDEKFTNDDSINKIAGILSITNADNIELAKILCKDEIFTMPHNIERIEGILRATNADNIELAKILCQNEKFTIMHNIWRISDFLEKTNADNIELAKTLCQDKKFTNDDNIWKIIDILAETNADSIELAKKVVKNKFIPVKMMSYIIKYASSYFKDYIDTDIFERIDNYKHKMLQNPELYINGESSNAKKEIKDFLEYNFAILTRAFDIFDKESIDTLFRHRLDDAGEYLDIIYDFDEGELQLLKKIVNCNNMSGKPLFPAQKVECIDLINAFKDNDISLSVIEEAIVDNKIDLGKIKLDLFKTILKNCGMSGKQIETMSKEKLMSWDLEYMHLLPKSMDDDEEAFMDLLIGTNSDDFIEYIHDTNNVYGKANKKTVNEFKKLNMNYEKWLHPDKNLETTFISRDKNSELLSQMAASVSDDIKELRENSAIKGFFDKQFKQYIEKDEFKIPQETANSKANLTELINNIIEQLKPVWERAEKNKDIPQKQETARKTLTLLSHLQTKLESLQKMNDIKREKPFDVTIKMWDRIPQKDLFQGNFSTCCIGMGEINAEAMPHYLMNTAFNMMELVDNNTGETIGNALCYFVQYKKGTPIFVIDNIEINNSQKPSEKTGIQLREKMFEYAKNIAKSITGKDTKVIMSNNYNDVSMEGLHKKSKSLKLVGDVDCDEIYMDLFDGWTDDWDEFEQVKYYGK